MNDRKYKIPEGNGKIVFRALNPPTAVSFLGTAYWNVRNALKATFGAFPFDLTLNDLPVLKAMVAAAGEGHTPYTELAEAVEKYGGVSVTLDIPIQQII